MAAVGHPIHRPIAVLESGLVNRWLKLSDLRANATYALHRCDLLLQMSHVSWSVCMCLSVCWSY